MAFHPTIELRERIEKAAREENRSMSNFVVNIVKEYLDINYPIEDNPRNTIADKATDDGPQS